MTFLVYLSGFGGNRVAAFFNIGYHIQASGEKLDAHERTARRVGDAYSSHQKLVAIVCIGRRILSSTGPSTGRQASAAAVADIPEAGW